ncbi:Crp/Fnr family transcriptional regulator [soil metagenome]
MFSRISIVPACEDCSTKSKSMFCNLDLPELKHLSEGKCANQFKKGQSIFYEGGQPHGVYCIYKGKVKIHTSDEDGREQIVRFARPGNIVGYRALLNGDNYSATATAMEDATVCYFSKQTFFELLKANSDFSLLAIRQLATDLKLAEHMLTSMAHRFVSERLAEALILLKECYGFEADSMILNVVISRREFANVVGTTTETAIRLLSEFKDKNLIRFHGKKIELTDLAALEQMITH